MELAELESKRGYCVGAADRIREKIGLPIPDANVRIALIEANLEKMERKIVFSEREIAVPNMKPQPKAKWKGAK